MPTATIAPKIEMPDRAFIPDMRGVCKRLGTFFIMKYPTTVETTKTRTKIIGLILYVYLNKKSCSNNHSNYQNSYEFIISVL